MDTASCVVLRPVGSVIEREGVRKVPESEQEAASKAGKMRGARDEYTGSLAVEP